MCSLKLILGFLFVCVRVWQCVRTCLCVCARVAHNVQSVIFSHYKFVDTIDIAKMFGWFTLTVNLATHSSVAACHCETLLQCCYLSEIFTTLYISDWNFKSLWPKTSHPFLFLLYVWLTFWATSLPKSNTWHPRRGGGNVIRLLTGAMVHPNQVYWRLHGMGGDSSAAYNPAYDTCAVGFAHSECEPYAHFAPYTACTFQTWWIPYAECDPLHSCNLHVPCMLHMPLIFHVTHIRLVTRMFRVPGMLRVPCILSSSSFWWSDILSLIFHYFYFLSCPSFLMQNIVHACVYIQISHTVFK